MLQAKISVVVPVYNAGEYLAPCIESILSQTMKEFELILVDDGSTDQSPCICTQYEKRDTRIKVIHKNNEGANKTRWRGVQEATADWITFCDADDTLTNDALQQMYSLHEGTDIVVGFINSCNKPLPFENDLEQCRHALIEGKLHGSPCAKLYHKTLLTKDVFDFSNEIISGEDLIMNVRVFFKTILSPHFLYKHIYNYRYVSSSLSHSKIKTLKHEETFYKALNDSIPCIIHPSYLKEITFLKFNGLFFIAFTQPRSLVDKHQPYLEQICQDAKACCYRMSLKEWLLIHSKSQIIIKLTGFIKLTSSFLKYRLHSLFKR